MDPKLLEKYVGLASYDDFVREIDKVDTSLILQQSVNGMPMLNYLISKSNEMWIEPPIRSTYRRMLDYFFKTNIKVRMNYDNDNDGTNPLIIALRYRDYDTAKILIEKGANINLLIRMRRSFRGSKVKLICDVINDANPEQFCTENKVIELFNFFKEHGSDYHLTNLCHVYSYRKELPQTMKIYETIVNSDFHLITVPTLINLACHGKAKLVIELINLGANFIDAYHKHHPYNLLQLMFRHELVITKGSDNAKLVKHLIRKGAPIDVPYSHDAKASYYVLNGLLGDLFRYVDNDCYVFELIIKNGGTFRNNKNPITTTLQRLAINPSWSNAVRFNHYNALRILRRYYDCEWEEVQLSLEKIREYAQKLRNESVIEFTDKLIKYIESWERVPTLRTLCLRMFKTKQCGIEYKDFVKGYFEWYDE